MARLTSLRTFAISGLIASVLLFSLATPASAASWTSTSLSLSSTSLSATGVTATFNFSGSSANTVACVTIDWTVNSDGTGGAPSGFNIQNASWDNSSTWLTISGWNFNKTTSGIRATQQNGAAPNTSGNRTIVLTNVTNGSSAGTYYASLKTYADQNCSSNQLIDTAVFGQTVGSSGGSASGNATLTVTAGTSFTMTVDGYNAGTCNGANITGTSSTGTNIPIGTISPTSSGVVGQTLTVSSTATNGYTVTVKATGLTNGTNTIASYSGTNLNPTVMPGAGTEGAGYTTDWSTLSTSGGGAANRFISNKWAGLSTTAAEVMYRPSGNTVAPGDVAHVCYQVNMSNLTPNGSYSSTVTYTATPSF